MTLFRCLRTLAIAVRPVIPTSSDNLLGQMGIGSHARDFAEIDNSGWFMALVATGFKLQQPVGVFPRLELLAEAAD